MAALCVALEQRPLIFAVKHIWTGKPLAQLENIVLGDVVEFVSVSCALGVYDAFAIAFVAEVAALAFEVVFDFLGYGEVVEGLHELEELVSVVEQRFPVIAA